MYSPANDVLFIDPVPADRLSEIYPSTYYSFTDPSESVLQRIKATLDRRLFRKVLGPMAGEQLKVLDVGGGAGWVLNQVRLAEPRATHTQVVDIDPGPAEIAEKNGHRYFCGRIEDFDTDEQYDLVLLLNLIEHVADPAALLERIGNHLTPQGRILVKTPNWDSLDQRVFRNRSWAGYHCPRHWVLFTRESFTRIAELSGLTVQEFSYTQGAPFWAASFLNWLAERGLARVDFERPVVKHPLWGPLNGLFAAVDFARMPFARTSQMFFVLGRA